MNFISPTALLLIVLIVDATSHAMNTNKVGHKSPEQLYNEVVGSHLIRNHIPGSLELLSSKFKKFLATPTLQKILQHDSSLEAINFSPDGSQILTVSKKNFAASLWNASTGALIHNLRHEGKIWSSFFSPDGSKILTGSGDSYIKLWNVQTGTALYTFNHPQCKSISFSPSGNKVVTRSSEQRTVKLWNVETGQLLHTLVHDREIDSAAFSSDGLFILTHSFLDGVRLWNSTDGTLVRTFAHAGTTERAIFSPDGIQVLTQHSTVISSGCVKLWDARTGNIIHIFLNNDGWDFNSSFNSTGTQVIIAGEDKKAKLYNTYSGDLIHTFEPGERVSIAQFSPDDSKLATASCNTAHLWNVFTGERMYTLQLGQGIASACFSSDGSNLLIGTYGSSAYLWDTSTGMLSFVFKNISTRYVQLCFSPDGTKVLSAVLVASEPIELQNSFVELFTRPLNRLRERLNLILFVHEHTEASLDETTQIKIWKLPDRKALQELMTHRNLNQIELLQAFELAIHEHSRIHVNLDSGGNELFETFNSFPSYIRQKLERFIVRNQKLEIEQSSS